MIKFEINLRVYMKVTRYLLQTCNTLEYVATHCERNDLAVDQARYRRCSLARLLLAVNIFSLIFEGTGAPWRFITGPQTTYMDRHCTLRTFVARDLKYRHTKNSLVF